jgi:hemerythrin-like domain-containing protein
LKKKRANAYTENNYAFCPGRDTGMLPIAPLMIEHRLIDRMIGLLKGETIKMLDGRVNLSFIDHALDFFKTYVDICHHKKEESILFRSLGGKDISPQHRRIMEELLSEHAEGRGIIDRLADAKGRFVRGDGGAREDMRGAMEKMIALYPPHIEKEDRHFFLPVMKYLSPEEQERMLAEMNEYDRKVVHGVYEEIVERFEVGSG